MSKSWDRLDGTVLHDPSEVGGFQDGAGGNPFSRSRIRYGMRREDVEHANRGTLTNMRNPDGSVKFQTKAPAFDLSHPSQHAMQAWHYAWAVEALRVLKPGGHLLAFGGTRTYHRLACAIEDAGFEIRDSILWAYGSGFPKSLDVSKAIDKAARGVPQGVADPTSPNHGAYKPDSQGAGGSRFLREPGDIDPATGRRIVETIPDRWAGKGDVLQRATQDARTEAYITEPATPEAREWDGWGTALKPAHEPICVARKPLGGTVAANVLHHGTGALNIAACRVGWGAEGDKSAERKAKGYSEQAKKALGRVVASESESGFSGEVAGSDATLGRWPSNLVLSHAPECEHVGAKRVKANMGISAGNPDGNGIYGKAFPRGDRREVGYGDEDGMETVAEWRCVEGCPVKALDEQSGLNRGASGPASGPTYSGPHKSGSMAGAFKGSDSEPVFYGDTGGASRFFPTFRYQAKASSAERNAGLDGFPERVDRDTYNDGLQGPRPHTREDYEWQRRGARNSHPTVKPLDLMRWLVRLVTPAGGVVLDPFTGSGSTGAAAVLEGFSFIGVEREPEYVAIARARIEFWAKHPTHLPVEEALAAERERGKVRDAGQLDLFG